MLYDAETKWEVRERERRRGGEIHTYTDIREWAESDEAGGWD